MYIGRNRYIVFSVSDNTTAPDTESSERKMYNVLDFRPLDYSERQPSFQLKVQG